MFNALASTNAAENLVLFRLPVAGNDDPNRLAHCFIARVAKDTGRRRIPGLDSAVEILGHDRVIRRFDDRRQVGLRQGCLNGFRRWVWLVWFGRHSFVASSE